MASPIPPGTPGLVAGVAKVNITPPVGTWLLGYANRDEPSIGIHTELYTRVFYFRLGTEQAVLVVNDLVGLRHNTVEEIRARIEKTTRIPSDRVMVANTHTHSGPKTIPMRIPGVVDQDYMATLAKDIVGAVQMAQRTAFNSRLSLAFGELPGFSVNRRDPQRGFLDTILGVLLLTDTHGHAMGCLYHFGAHPVVLGPSNLMISGDFPGVASRILEEQQGNEFVAGFVNASHGDINVHPRGDISICEERGCTMAAAVQALFDKTLPVEVDRLAAVRRTLCLPLLGTAKRDVLLTDAENAELPAWHRQWARDMLRMYPDEAEISGEAEGEVMVIRLGDFALVGFPGHLFAQVGADFRQSAAPAQVFVINWANGHLGYLPSREAVGGYELNAYRINSDLPAPLNYEATELLFQAALELLRETDQY